MKFVVETALFKYVFGTLSVLSLCWNSPDAPNVIRRAVHSLCVNDASTAIPGEWYMDTGVGKMQRSQSGPRERMVRWGHHDDTTQK